MQLFESLNNCFGGGTTQATKTAAMLKGGCDWSDIGPIINELLKNLLLVGIFIAMIMISYAGYVLVKGHGSPDSRTKAKNIFLGIVIGLILLVGSYYIVEFVLDTLNISDEYRKVSLPKR